MTHDLDRFLVAQEQEQDGYLDALAQLRRGSKTGHWMWWIFPQIAGLGETDRSRYYAIAFVDEARAYSAHNVLGIRLLECARAMLGTEGRTAESILGTTDAKKLRSCMTLFLRAAPDEPLFGQVLDRFFDGIPDDRTDAKLRDQAASVPDLEAAP